MRNHTLPQYDLEELAHTMIALLDGWEDKRVGWLKLQNLLLEGRPLSPARIAESLHLTQEEVADLIKGAELDQNGNVVGFGLSLVPTPHVYQMDGRQYYVWCAADAITFPLLHKRAAVIESPDPISGEQIRLTSTPEDVARHRDARHPGLVVVPIEQVFQIGQLMWNREPYQSIIAAL